MQEFLDDNEQNSSDLDFESDKEYRKMLKVTSIETNC